MPETIEAPPAIKPHEPAEPAFKEMLGNLLGKKQGSENEKEPEEPAMWAVLLHNDNSTFPDFVVEVLRDACKVEGNNARRIMMQAHTTGQAVVTVTTKEQAETMLHNTQEMVAKAKPGEHFYSRAEVCQLTFSIRQETKDG